MAEAVLNQLHTPSEPYAVLPRSSSDNRIIQEIGGTLDLAGFKLEHTHRILDFGCGTGRHVAVFREAGYDAYGVDLRDFFQSAPAGQKSWFSLSSNRYIYQLPYPDHYFDVIYSTHVLEHVVYYEPALEEMRRVLKPEGITIHIFPSKWRPIEPHFFAPFGGSIPWWPWLILWGMAGLVNPSLPKSLSLSERAAVNWKASRTNYTYYSLRELKFLFGLYFGNVRFVEKEFVLATVSTSRFSRLVKKASKVFPPIFWLYRHFHTRVVALDGYGDPERFREGWILY